MWKHYWLHVRCKVFFETFYFDKINSNKTLPRILLLLFSSPQYLLLDCNRKTACHNYLAKQLSILRQNIGVLKSFHSGSNFVTFFIFQEKLASMSTQTKTGLPFSFISLPFCCLVNSCHRSFSRCWLDWFHHYCFCGTLCHTLHAGRFCEENNPR